MALIAVTTHSRLAHIVWRSQGIHLISIEKMFCPSLPTSATSKGQCLTELEIRALVDDTLSREQQAKCYSHLDTCTMCQIRLEESTCLVSDSADWQCTDSTAPNLAADVISHLRNSPHPATGSDGNPSFETLCGMDEETRELQKLQDRSCPAEIVPCGEVQLRVLERAGEGGMAVIFRCQEESTGREVAVKVLRHRFAANDEARQQFLQEAEIQGKLEGNGVASVFETGEFEDGRLFMVMEYRKGKTLSQRMRACRNRTKEKASFLNAIRQTCKILAPIHEQGIQHRDLKPANIHLGVSGEVTILDWGLANSPLAKQHERCPREELPSPIVDLCRTIVGTPGYSSPEQIRGDATGPSADVYSLGVILAELLTGERFSEHEDFITSERESKLATEQALSRVRECGASIDLIELVQSCLSHTPAARPQNAGQLLQKLEQAVCHG